MSSLRNFLRSNKNRNAAAPQQPSGGPSQVGVAPPVGVASPPGYNSVVPSLFRPSSRGPTITRDRPDGFDRADYCPTGYTRIPFTKAPLKEVNTVFIVDDSSSMTWYGDKNWNQLMACLPEIIDAILQNDKDGIDWYWMNEMTDETGDPDEGLPGTGYNGIQNPDFVVQLAKERRAKGDFGATPIGLRLKMILDTYVTRCEQTQRLLTADEKSRLPAGYDDWDTARQWKFHGWKYQALPKPLNLIVWTDGDASDKDLVESSIVNAARRLGACRAPLGQCGIQFFQVGNDQKAKNWLKGLDDDLKNKYGLDRDIVDTKNYEDVVRLGGFTAETLYPIVAGAFLESLDALESGQTQLSKQEESDDDLF